VGLRWHASAASGSLLPLQRCRRLAAHGWLLSPGEDLELTQRIERAMLARQSDRGLLRVILTFMLGYTYYTFSLR
jgi:hypothetical protein